MAAPSSATSSHDAAYDRAAQAIANADAVLITAGAGLGVDSGLPDFRGVNGFWRAYPPMKHLQLRFEEMSTPSWFAKDPEFAWGFWGHRISLYRDAQPHEGYTLLRELAEAKELPYFVFTSNVDGHFLRAGFDPDRLVECHGSTQFMQCTKNCKHELWSSDSVNVAFSEETFRTTSPDQVPKCQFCGAVARPNVLMFGDYGFDWQRVHTQEANFASWKQAVKGKRVVVVEIGCGKYVPTVRHQSEEIISTHGTVFSTLVRINPRDSDIPASCYDLDSAAVDEEQGEDESWPERPHVSLAVGGLEALQAIATKVASTSSS